MKRLLIIPLLSLATIIGSAQTKKWSMDECMAYAVQNSFSVKRADIGHRNAKLGYTNSILSHLPSLNAGVSAGANFGRGIDPETNTYINTATFSNGINANTSLPLFNGLAYTNTTRTSKIAVLSGMEAKRMAEDKVAQDCMMAYIQVVYERSLVSLTSDKLKSSRLNLRKTVLQDSLGVKSSADVAQMDAEVASDEFTLISRQNNLEISILKLKDLMNYPINSELDIEDNIETIRLSDENEDVAAIYTEAIKTLPSALIGTYDLETSRLKLQTARWSLLPSVNAGGGIGTNYFKSFSDEKNGVNYFDQLSNNLGEYASMSMSIPLFSGLNRRTKLNIAKNDYTQAKNDWDEKQRTIQSEIEQAVMECASAEKQWIQAQKSAASLEIAHKANQNKYDNGQLSIIELQISANTLLAARAEQVYQRLRYIVLCRQVNYYKGIPYIN